MKVRTKTTRPPRKTTVPTKVDRNTPIWKWLERSNLSMKEFARVIGVTRRSLYWWATGKQLPGVIYALRIAMVTNNGVPVECWLETEKGREVWKMLGEGSRKRHTKLIEEHVTNG